jgi:acyl-CoA synthetase (NDP forming)
VDNNRTLELHRLQPLLAPRSIAVVGASTRVESFSFATIREVLDRGYEGGVYPVNPRYQQIEELPCYASLKELPEVPDLAIMAVANERLEAQMLSAADAGVPAAAIFGSGYLAEEAGGRSLVTRVKSIAREAGIRICGGNCMGFRNVAAKTHVAIMTEPNLVPGPVAFISHSGTAYGQMLDLDGRAGYQLVVSAGQEHTVSVAEYIDYALQMPGTRCIALFLETVRDPEAFVAALEAARAANIPVVALKVGRSEAAAGFAVTHSGALVGDDAAYQALFERHGVIRVRHLGEMVNVIQLLCYSREPVPGGLAALMDSGGKRELMMDLVDEIGLPVAEISEATRATLANNLDIGLEPVNPLDFWGTGFDWHNRIGHCATALAEDADSAICVLAGIMNWAGSTAYVDILCEVALRTRKPLAILTEFLRVDDVPSIEKLNASGVAVLVGEQSGLSAIGHVSRYQKFLHQPVRATVVASNPEVVARWRERLSTKLALDESNSLAMLRDFGVSTVPFEIADDASAVVAAADRLGYPVVLKTAMPGIAHKTDVGGVMLDLGDQEALLQAYQALESRLGSEALIASQVKEPGVELALGMVLDPVVGPLVMVSAGGMLIEVLDDKVCALAPIDKAEAAEMIDRLSISKLLGGFRGSGALNVDALAETIARFSVCVWQLADVLAEVDVNPLLVTQAGCVVLDALVAPRQP